MRTTEEGIALIKKWEGFRKGAYQDSVGVWTIGYGTTAAANVGINPKRGDTVTEEQADTFLRLYVAREEKGILNLVKVPLNDNQLSALSSFVYNLGLPAFKGSTLLRKLNAGDYKGASAEFPKWNKAGGKVLRGLVSRRAEERAMFDTKATQVAKTQGGLLGALLEALRGIFK